MNDLRRYRRRCDAAIRRIRYIDGVIDALWSKVKEYFEDLKRKLSSVGWGRKILFIFGKLIKAISVAFIGHNVVALVKLKMDMPRIKEKALKEMEENYQNFVEGPYDRGMAEQAVDYEQKKRWNAQLKEGLIINFCNLITALLGYAAEKIAIPDKV